MGASSTDDSGAWFGGGTRAAQLRAVGTAFLRRRPLIVAPMMFGALAILRHHRVPSGQLHALGASFAIVLAFFLYEAWRGGRKLVSAGRLAASLFATLVMVSLGCLLTGGAGSPLLPLLFAPTVITFAAFGRRVGAVMLGALAAAMAGLWVLPAGVPFPPLPAEAHRSIAALTVLGAGALSWVGVTGLSDAYADVRATLGRAGESVIEATEARAAALESLGASVAHELRNPLAAMKGLVELLLEGREPERAPKRLGVVRSEVERMEAILEGYLSFSRPLGAFAPVPVDLVAVARETVALLEARAERGGVALLVAPDASPGDAPSDARRVDGDPRRLKEALLNLVLNALQATPSGGSVRVGARRDGDGVSVFVEDTGRGMSPEILARLGQAYFTTRTEGVGLGVRLARQVATLHGGDLVFSSAPGRGTRATLWLPARASVRSRP